MKNVDNWEVNISGYCSHVISVIEKKKLKKNLGPDSNLTRATSKLKQSPWFMITEQSRAHSEKLKNRQEFRV